MIISDCTDFLVTLADVGAGVIWNGIHIETLVIPVPIWSGRRHRSFSFRTLVGELSDFTSQVLLVKGFDSLEGVRSFEFGGQYSHALLASKTEVHGG